MEGRPSSYESRRPKVRVKVARSVLWLGHCVTVPTGVRRKAVWCGNSRAGDGGVRLDETDVLPVRGHDARHH